MRGVTPLPPPNVLLKVKVSISMASSMRRAHDERLLNCRELDMQRVAELTGAPGPAEASMHCLNLVVRSLLLRGGRTVESRPRLAGLSLMSCLSTGCCASFRFLLRRRCHGIKPSKATKPMSSTPETDNDLSLFSVISPMSGV